MNPKVKRAIQIAGAVLGAYLSIRLLDLLMAWGLYSWFFGNIRDAAGLPDTLNGAVSVWFTVIALLLIPTFLSVLFFRQTTKKMLIIASAVSGWVVVMYFLAQPRQDQYFNPMTGQAMYKYYQNPDGNVEFFPLGYKFHPRYGTPLLPLTPEVIRQMEEQKAKELEQQRIREQERQKSELEQKNREAEQKARELALAAEQAKAWEREKQVNSTERQGGNIVRPLRAQDTGLVPEGWTVEADDLEGEIDLTKLDFSLPVIRDGEIWVNGDTVRKRAAEAKAYGSLGFAYELLKAENEGKNVFPVVPIGKHYFLVFPRTVLRDRNGIRVMHSINFHNRRWGIDPYLMGGRFRDFARFICPRK